MLTIREKPVTSLTLPYLISSTGLPYFHRKKGRKITTVTHLSVSSTLTSQIKIVTLISFKHWSKTCSV